MLWQLLTGFLAAALIAIVSRRAALLTRDGAIAQFFLGWAIFGLGGWKWATPILVFFISSSMLSRVALKRKAAVEHRYQKVGCRDSGQVMANGGIAGALVIADFVFPSAFWYLAALGSLAAANADTWGSEIGILSRNAPLLVTSLKKTLPGTSGGITVLGSAAGLAGGLLVALSGLFWIDPSGRESALWIVPLAAILGSLVDSLSGASLQAQYRCRICGTITERSIHCGTVAEHSRGARFITNDTVNLLCTAAGAAAAAFLSTL